MQYIFFHKRIRNDDHCPLCRRYYISIHENLEPVYTETSEYFTNEVFDNLKKGKVVWVDEWVRRRNGDKYQIFKVIPEKTYDLHQWNHADEINNEHKVQHMFLHVNLNKSKWCPDNINYTISFHKTLEEACIKGARFLDSIADMESLKTLQPIWQANDSNGQGSGDHYQIIPLECGKRLCLNDYCAHAQPQSW